MKCQNNYCKKCIDNLNTKNEKCPNGCDSPTYKDSLAKKDILSKLKFSCVKCGNEIPYYEAEKHHDSCKVEKSLKKNKKENLTTSNLKMKKISAEETSKLVEEGNEIKYITGK